MVGSSHSFEAVALVNRTGELLADIRSAEAELGALWVEIDHRGVLDLSGYRTAERLLEHLTGWEVRIALDGHPGFLPPPFLDEHRKPWRINRCRLRLEQSNTG